MGSVLAEDILDHLLSLVSEIILSNDPVHGYRHYVDQLQKGVPHGDIAGRDGEDREHYAINSSVNCQN